MKLSSGLVFAFPPGHISRRVRQRKHPVQERSGATVEAILAATLQVLIRDGSSGITTTKVAARAGVSVGTLYQYYADKASLVNALKVRHAEVAVSSFAQAAAAFDGAPLEQSLPAIIDGVLASKRENLELLVALRDTGAPTDPLMKETSRALLAVAQRLLESSLPGLENSALKARMLLCLVDGPVSYALREAPRLLRDEAFAAELKSAVLSYVRGLGQSAQAGRMTARASRQISGQRTEAKARAKR